MKGGRKNLKRASEGKDTVTLLPGQTIMQVLSLRGSNLIEVLDAKGSTSLALFPAKFQKSMWIKTGNFVVVDESGREEAVESGRKVGCIVSQVLYHEQVRALKKSPEWPETFRSASPEVPVKVPSTCDLLQEDNEMDSSDDGLPPLEANMNRTRPAELQSDADSDSDSDATP
ncbi:hypothetical protein DCAR_0310703 [Daucus carota subsp. sativus]|uniref:S1-like domain-containing protein n=1 Tax=Daucus carota subsp. sativus TaxID=79200 RepID=A0AAF1AQ74_DAUCS|nr:PREDICTED: probable RNA-binding protein EIF1AD [Daucus carota subsp. sativus]WOG91454.1 hypothetical protein DCAR_0310703 [Daucus carota subsp. sativus]